MVAKTLLLGLLAFVACVGCGGDGGEPTAEIQPTKNDVVNRSGIVRELGSHSYVIEDTDRKGTRYAPTNLPPEFEVDGMRVIFSGTKGEIPPNVRLVGTPLELSAIVRDER